VILIYSGYMSPASKPILPSYSQVLPFAVFQVLYGSGREVKVYNRCDEFEKVERDAAASTSAAGERQDRRTGAADVQPEGVLGVPGELRGGVGGSGAGRGGASGGLRAAVGSAGSTDGVR
jgi:hypothetical protein